VQIVIGNDNTDVESTVNQFVSDYNSLVSALNTQEATQARERLTAVRLPTLTLLQEQLLGSVNTQNPNGYLDAVSSAQEPRSPVLCRFSGQRTARPSR